MTGTVAPEMVCKECATNSRGAWAPKSSLLSGGQQPTPMPASEMIAGTGSIFSMKASVSRKGRSTNQITARRGWVSFQTEEPRALRGEVMEWRREAEEEGLVLLPLPLLPFFFPSRPPPPPPPPLLPPIGTSPPVDGVEDDDDLSPPLVIEMERLR